MQRVSFRPFIIFALIAAVVVTAGVVLYWRQVNILLERDVKTHIADAGREAATDFDRLVQTDRDILNTSAILIEDSYPWKEGQLPEMLARLDQRDHFNLMGVALDNGTVVYAGPSVIPLSKEAVSDVLARTDKNDFYINVFPPTSKYKTHIMVQAVALDPNDATPVGALFSEIGRAHV